MQNKFDDKCPNISCDGVPYLLYKSKESQQGKIVQQIPILNLIFSNVQSVK